MATSSIFYNVIINDEESAKKFVDLLDASEKTKHIRPRANNCRNVDSIDEMHAFFDKKMASI